MSDLFKLLTDAEVNYLMGMPTQKLHALVGRPDGPLSVILWKLVLHARVECYTNKMAYLLNEDGNSENGEQK